jgi:hypothetical protein
VDEGASGAAVAIRARMDVPALRVRDCRLGDRREAGSVHESAEILEQAPNQRGGW